MKTYHLKLTSALALNGEVIRAKTVVEVDEKLAMNLLHRGKAVVATEADGAPSAPADGDIPAGVVDISRMNKAQLTEAAKDYGIEGADEMTKAQLVQAIEAKTAKPTE